MQQKFDHIILTGSIAIDRIMNFGGNYADLIQPDKLHVLSLSVIIDSLKDSPGGTAANIAYTLALLGDHPILLASLGKSEQKYLADLASVGVDTTHAHLSDLPTASFTVLTDRADNQVGGFFIGAMGDSAGLSLTPWANTRSLVVVSAGDTQAMGRFVQESSQLDLHLLYDVGQQVSNLDPSSLKSGIEHADVLFVNDYELSILAERSGYTVAEIEAKVPVVVTTLGKEGANITGQSLSAPLHVAAIPNVEPLDPTGAGDSFRAGFIYGYSRGYDLVTCVQLGCCAGAYAVETQGTQAHHFTLTQFIKRYQNNYGGIVHG